MKRPCTKSRHTCSSLCNLCVLCASVVEDCLGKTTTETQRNAEVAQRITRHIKMSNDAMIFYDNYEAPLTAGSYRFVLQQTVNLEGDEARHYYHDQRFEVLAPRYSIDRDEIQAYFPPEGGVADYQNVLPHLVLRSRNLPWERTLSHQKEPWLALLMLSEQEIVDGNALLKNGTLADLVPQRPDDLPIDDDSLETWWRPADIDTV